MPVPGDPQGPEVSETCPGCKALGHGPAAGGWTRYTAREGKKRGPLLTVEPGASGTLAKVRGTVGGHRACGDSQHRHMQAGGSRRTPGRTGALTEESDPPPPRKPPERTLNDMSTPG